MELSAKELDKIDAYERQLERRNKLGEYAGTITMAVIIAVFGAITFLIIG